MVQYCLHSNINTRAHMHTPHSTHIYYIVAQACPQPMAPPPPSPPQDGGKNPVWAEKFIFNVINENR